MLTALGLPAFTPFRLKQKIEKLRQLVRQVEDIQSHYIYFFTLKSPFSPLEKQKFEELLDAKLGGLDPRLMNTPVCIVYPRTGTISPWSSKASNILQNCGFSNILRIEMGVLYQIFPKEGYKFTAQELAQMIPLLHDPLTQSVAQNLENVVLSDEKPYPKPMEVVSLLDEGEAALIKANQQYGLALSEEDITYLYQHFLKLSRNPTDVELMMYGQVNSEHCRHKIFNAAWTIQNELKQDSLFDWIRKTYHPATSVAKVAYKDNAAIIKGRLASRWFRDPATCAYHFVEEEADFCIKVETHNHPTAISPWAGAATGIGGEIRDEAATGRGSMPKAGLTGFMVSHLNIPHLSQPWEKSVGHPSHSNHLKHLATPLEIMLQAPMGGSSFNNEFGRPQLGGFFRTFEYEEVQDKESQKSQWRGYHKPILIAGGLGQIRPTHTYKQIIKEKNAIVVLGGAGMSIGLGGGAASSLSSGMQSADLDFSSVQRANPEMERRAQEIINDCISLGEKNPIRSIHDVGAGGLSNAVPEIVHQDGYGLKAELRLIPTDESNMSPLAIWCNESQERYVLAIDEADLDSLEKIAARERCPLKKIGEVTSTPHLVVKDEYFQNTPIEISMDALFNHAPKLKKSAKSQPLSLEEFCTDSLSLNEAIARVLQHPTVSDKKFLVTIGDRSVTGLVARDQMIGPWQVPVSDVAVTSNSFLDVGGEAMAMGERPPIALLSPKASVRMALGEALTNLASADIFSLKEVVVSANWMASAESPHDAACLYEGVEALSKFCQQLGVGIPVGKDSLSMRASWSNEKGVSQTISSPLSLVITAFASVKNVQKTLTPQLQRLDEETDLILIDLPHQKNRLGGSILAHVYHQLGHQCPDVDHPEIVLNFFSALQQLKEKNLICAYHDRSDGGVFVTLCEMAFASHCGLVIHLDPLLQDPFRFLFNEELGAVIQVQRTHTNEVLEILKKEKLYAHLVGKVHSEDTICIRQDSKIVYKEKRVVLQRLWSRLSFTLQSLRDNPQTAQEEYDQILDDTDPGLSIHLTFNPDENIVSTFANFTKPKVAILREQGVNGHYEMAVAFEQAGFLPIDVHMTDLLSKKIDLSPFVGLVACGGFSYGDVLGAGRGWANTILYHPYVRNLFEHFFQREDTFTLGVCNGAQMLAHLKLIIPGTENWPIFVRNRSEQFESRLSLVEILESPSIFFKDMIGSKLPIVISHGEGQAKFESGDSIQKLLEEKRVAMRYIHHHGQPTQLYPFNPNGSPEGITALTSKNGRVLSMMPHPERVCFTKQFSWYPQNFSQQSPWLRLFRNARMWVG